MSTDLYHRRLIYYAGRGGIAKEGDLVLTLRAPPPVFPAVVELDYGEIHPGDHAYTPFLRTHSYSKRRDMTPEEIVSVRRWLSALLTATMTAAAAPPATLERRK